MECLFSKNLSKKIQLNKKERERDNEHENNREKGGEKRDKERECRPNFSIINQEQGVQPVVQKQGRREGVKSMTVSRGLKKGDHENKRKIE